jgi:uncharacterized protein (TIGR03435 family)
MLRSALALVLAVAAHAQHFEAASVKRNASGDAGGAMRTEPGGRFVCTNSTLRALLRYAWNVRDFQIAGAPEWFEADRYDVTATANRSVAIAEVRLMVQHLLAERFGLTTHREKREMPVYALVVGSRGVRMKENAEGDTTVATAPGQIEAHKLNLNMLANQLAGLLGQAVVNRTELKGTYDVKLQWSPDATPDPSGPSIFAAVQEQLGLKLESQKGPVEVLVVDSVKRTPVEN